MQSTQKSNRKTHDTVAIKESAIKEVLPDGLRAFPDNFVSPSAKFKPMPLSPGTWQKGEYLLGQQQLVHESGKNIVLPDVDTSEYVLFAQKPSGHLIKVPVDHTELVKAVSSYKKYLKSVREDLARALVMRTGDQNLSERLSAQLMEELGVLF